MELQTMITRLEREAAPEAILDLVRIALDLSEQRANLELTRERVRRQAAAGPDDLELFADQADELDDATQCTALLEVLQAAAVSACNLTGRCLMSGRLAVAAKSGGQFERARQAYADAIAGLQILIRFFNDDGTAARAEQSLLAGWEAVREQSGRPLGILDPATDDPVHELFELILWNTEVGSEHGLLAQVDATIRLAVHLEHLERSNGRLPGSIVAELTDLSEGRESDELVSRSAISLGIRRAIANPGKEPVRDVYLQRSGYMSETATQPGFARAGEGTSVLWIGTLEGDDADEDGEDSLLQARYLVTLGDALMEVAQWEAAARVHAAVLADTAADASHPLGMHAAVQEAWCHLQLGDRDACQASLQKVNKDLLERLADLVITVAAELARYVSVEAVLLARAGSGEAAACGVRSRELVSSTSVIASRHAGDRVSYLRTLFHAILARDVEQRLAGI